MTIHPLVGNTIGKKEDKIGRKARHSSINRKRLSEKHTHHQAEYRFNSVTGVIPVLGMM